jgi:hypothetical protein
MRFNELHKQVGRAPDRSAQRQSDHFVAEQGGHPRRSELRAVVN